MVFFSLGVLGFIWVIPPWRDTAICPTIAMGLIIITSLTTYISQRYRPFCESVARFFGLGKLLRIENDTGTRDTRRLDVIELGQSSRLQSIGQKDIVDRGLQSRVGSATALGSSATAVSG